MNADLDAVRAVLDDLLRECLDKGMTPEELSTMAERIIRSGGPLNNRQMFRLAEMLFPEAEWALDRRRRVTTTFADCRFDILPSSKVVLYDCASGIPRRVGTRWLRHDLDCGRLVRMMRRATFPATRDDEGRYHWRTDPCPSLRLLYARLDYDTRKIVRTPEEATSLLPEDISFGTQYDSELSFEDEVDEDF